MIRELGSDKAFDNDTLEKMLSGAGMEGVASSYVYIVDSDGTMLYHPNKDKIGSSVENSVVKAYVLDLKSGISHDTSVVEYDYNGAVKYASCYTGMDKSFIIVI